MAKNPYRGCEFLTSASKSFQFPADTGREVAFVGRSNVGKSSIINCLTDNKNLAKTSKTPGRTRLINFFSVDQNIRLVDLPGYGFARVDKSMKNQWRKMINDYLTCRSSLRGIILIIDIRRQLKADDIEMIDWCVESDLQVHVIANKADKLAYNRQKTAMETVRHQLKPACASSQLFSVVRKTGFDETVLRLNSWLKG